MAILRTPEKKHLWDSYRFQFFEHVYIFEGFSSTDLKSSNIPKPPLKTHNLHPRKGQKKTRSGANHGACQGSRGLSIPCPSLYTTLSLRCETVGNAGGKKRHMKQLVRNAKFEQDLEPDGHPFIKGCLNLLMNQIFTWEMLVSPFPSI